MRNWACNKSSIQFAHVPSVCCPSIPPSTALLYSLSSVIPWPNGLAPPSQLGGETTILSGGSAIVKFANQTGTNNSTPINQIPTNSRTWPIRQNSMRSKSGLLSRSLKPMQFPFPINEAKPFMISKHWRFPGLFCFLWTKPVPLYLGTFHERGGFLPFNGGFSWQLGC